MDFAALASFFESSSIVAWFAVLVAIFALFVGLGLYAANRGSRHRTVSLLEHARIDELTPSPTRRASDRSDRRVPRARNPGPRARSRRELKPYQETS